MAAPRTPYGPNLPGRLAGTMVKVLAAEMSDQSRLARGKRYHADGAVIDIVIGHGAVTAEVRGSRYEPYVVTIETDPGSGVPARREIWAQCTCPDDTGTGTELCKHAVAAMFTLSDEVAIEPELIDRWRASRRPRPTGGVVTELDRHRREPDLPTSERDRPAAVIPLHGGERDTADARDAAVDILPMMLRAPAGAVPATFPDVATVDHGALRDAMLRDVLDDALDHLDLRWE
jgi:hypothetical protein